MFDPKARLLLMILEPQMAIGLLTLGMHGDARFGTEAAHGSFLVRVVQPVDTLQSQLQIPYF
jgi:precorrin-6x reductase